MHATLLQSCLILCDLMDCSTPGSSVPGDSPGKNTGVGCLHLLHLLHWQVGSLLLVLPGKPTFSAILPQIQALEGLGLTSQLRDSQKTGLLPCPLGFFPYSLA